MDSHLRTHHQETATERPWTLPALGLPSTTHSSSSSDTFQSQQDTRPAFSADELGVPEDELVTAGVDSSTVGLIEGIRNQDLHPSGQPKRPMNAFMFATLLSSADIKEEDAHCEFRIFARHRRPAIQQKEPGLKTGDISKRLSHDWKILPDIDKAHYLEQARILKDEFHTRFPDYVYKRRPNNTVSGKKRVSSTSHHGKFRSPSDDNGPPSSTAPPRLPPLSLSHDDHRFASHTPAESSSYYNLAAVDRSFASDPSRYLAGTGTYTREADDRAAVPRGAGLARPASIDSLESPHTGPSDGAQSRPSLSGPSFQTTASMSGSVMYDYDQSRLHSRYDQPPQPHVAPPATVHHHSAPAAPNYNEVHSHAMPYVYPNPHARPDDGRRTGSAAPLFSTDARPASPLPLAGAPAEPGGPASFPPPPRSSRSISAPQVIVAAGLPQPYSQPPPRMGADASWTRSSWSSTAEQHHHDQHSSKMSGHHQLPYGGDPRYHDTVLRQTEQHYHGYGQLYAHSAPPGSFHATSTAVGQEAARSFYPPQPERPPPSFPTLTAVSPPKDRTSAHYRPAR